MSSTTKPPTPRLRIRRATPDDGETIARIHFDAFGPGIMNRLIYPGGVGETARANFVRAVMPQPDEAADPLVEKIVMVAELLPEQGEGQAGGQAPVVVASAKWKLVKEAQPREKWDEADREVTAEELGEGADAAVYNAFIGGLNRKGREWMKGEPCLHLGILACSRSCQRLGVGTALLEWGCELADRENKTAWLEASPQGYRLYRRFGFEEVDVQDLDVTGAWGVARTAGEDWGAGCAVALAGELPEGSFRTVIMRRTPRVGRA